MTHSEGQDYLYEAKLLILGEGGAGKTTLARKIQNPSYQLQDEQTTRGIDVLQWSFHLQDGKLFRVNIWDFGGQEIYHTTHQFFLTKRSSYILVADTRREDTDFYYWLNVVELLSDKSPLLIVKNEKQDRHREINERLLRGQFENLKEVLSANLATNRGLDNIIREIKHYIINLPHIGSPLPKTWVRVREALESDHRDHITFDEYLLICKENGFTRLKDSLQLSGYLHDLGVCLHFQDDPLLRKTIVLKPNWGTDAVYKVLDNPTVIRNLGRFSHEDLAVIWSTHEYTGMHDELLQLMMKFRLCYQIPNSIDTYIAPQLLTENQPSYQWDKEDDLLLRYSYEFMPKGILTQFIVSMNPYIATTQNKSLVWKSGIVLTKDKTVAEVIELYGKREIHVRIAGAHKKEFLTIIMHELDKIHVTYKRLKYDKLIPCNCHECKISKEPYFYRFEILQKFIEDRQEQIQCQHSYEMVNTRGLIDDILKVQYGRGDNEQTSGTHQIHITIGNNSSVGSIILDSTIKNSFNKAMSANVSDELKLTLRQLVHAVEEMNNSLPQEKAMEIVDHLEKLVNETTKEVPNKIWYPVSIDGLTKAAANLGKVGEPVIKLAGKILALLATT